MGVTKLAVMHAALLNKLPLLRHLWVAALGLLAAVVMTWPLAPAASDHVLAAIYHWDAFANTMILGSRVDAIVGNGPLSLHDNYFFAPLPNSIVFNENHFGLALIFAPFYLLTGNPLLAYNLTLLVSLALSVYFTQRLVQRLTGSPHAGILAAVAFAFCPYVFFEMGRIQLIATQWIPACFLFLHRAIEGQRRRDVVGLWLAYLLQIGTCLYYAMFLIPLLGLVGAVLLVRHRPPTRLYWQLAGAGALAGVVALSMVYPYFSARASFDLERSLAFASSYDGKLDFLLNVHETNHTLTALHHQSAQRGAHEEIAFPGFSVLLLLSIGFGVALWKTIRPRDARQLGVALLSWLLVAALAITATLAFHSMLAGALLLAGAAWLQSARGQPSPFAGRQGLYLALLLLSLGMFLGHSPLQWQGEPVRGLYYYFHTYFPGFNGIRKVSRQAVMTTFGFCILSSFASAWLFSRLSKATHKALLLAALLSTSCYELRAFPHPLKEVWAGDTVPKVYDFVASLPEQDLIASMPQNDGVSRFWGDRGMALHNYLALYHKHRFLNGQSSWMPPVTDLVRRALIHLPDDEALRVLQIVGTQHLLLHAEDLPAKRRGLPEQLAAQPERYQRVFQEEEQSVFTLVGPHDPSLALLEVPLLPRGAQRLPASNLKLRSRLGKSTLRKATDNDPKSFWSSRQLQAPGDSLQLTLSEPRRIVALELDNPGQPMRLPLSFALDVSTGGTHWQTAMERPFLRLYRDQIYAPKQFVFRIVLPESIVADRIRIRVLQPMPGLDLRVHEVRVYAEPR